MRVLVSSPGRYHSVYLATALLNNNCLQRFFYGGVPADKSLFPSSKMYFNDIVSFTDRVFVKLKLDRWFLLSRWYTWRDSFFDNMVASRLLQESQADIFVAWANGCRKSLVVAKKMGCITIVEAGSMHIVVQEKILKSEFAKHGKVPTCVLLENKKRMLDEYLLADFIAVPSEHVKKTFIESGIPSKKIIKIPYGCNVKMFLTRQSKSRVGPLIFLFVGAISLQKGIAYLLKAWSDLKLPFKDAQLHLVGNVTWDAQELVDQYSSEKNIVFYGPRRHDDLVSFYQKSHVFLFPSLQEGLAMVIGEAMAAGLVVICSKNSGGYELLNDGESGFILKEVSELAISEKILWCLENRESLEVISERAKVLAQKYSWEDYGNRVCEIYRELLECPE